MGCDPSDALLLLAGVVTVGVTEEKAGNCGASGSAVASVVVPPSVADGSVVAGNGYGDWVDDQCVAQVRAAGMPDSNDCKGVAVVWPLRTSCVV